MCRITEKCGLVDQGHAGKSLVSLDKGGYDEPPHAVFQRGSNKLAPRLPQRPQPTLWAMDLAKDDGLSTTRKKTVIIPLDDLRNKLILHHLDSQEAYRENVVRHVRFYRNWYPVETLSQFQKAREHFKRSGRPPPATFLQLEQGYWPDINRFAHGLADNLNGWCDEISRLKSIQDYQNIRLSRTINLFRGYEKKFGEENLKALRAAFARVYEVLNNEKVQASTAYGPFMMSRVAHVAGLTTDTSAQVFIDSFKTTPPREMLKEMGRFIRDYRHLDASFLTKIWDFLMAHASVYGDYDEYVDLLDSFLSRHPQYVSDYLQRHDTLASQSKRLDRALPSIDVNLVTRGLLPDDQKHTIYCFILKPRADEWDEALQENYYKDCKNLVQIEDRVVSRMLKFKSGDRDDIDFNHEVKLGLAILRAKVQSFAKDGKSKDFLVWLERVVPRKVWSKMGLSRDLLRLVIDKDDRVATKLLDHYRRPLHYEKKLAKKDPLWKVFWDASYAALPFKKSEWIEAAGLFLSDSYAYHAESLPRMMMVLGMEDVVHAYFRDNHPYRAFFTMPKDMRPMGRGQGYFSMDYFPDPKKHPHPEKSDVDVLEAGDQQWAPSTAKAHGFLVTSLAVGEKTGLAPQANLTVSSSLSHESKSLALRVLDALRAVKKSLEDNPRPAVIGFSLGLEVPPELRQLAEESAIYQDLKRVCEELYRMHVPIVVAAGNSGNKNGINLLGFLPHVILVGAVNSNRTRSRKDDFASDYTTGSDAVNPVFVGAYAGPVFYVTGNGRNIWAEKGGTSSAQPHLAATLMMMREVNPTLSIAELKKIIAKTSDPLKGDKDKNNVTPGFLEGLVDVPAKKEKAAAPYLGLDPMEAVAQAARQPGSTYTGDRLKKLLKGISSTF